MSSSNYPNHHEPTFCPSCGKRKTDYTSNVEEKFTKQHFEPSSYKNDHHSIKQLLNLLIALLSKFEFDKEPKSPHHECKCKEKHDKDKYDWWKHDNKYDDSSSCECKCNKHHDWKEHDKKHEKPECKCNKHHDKEHHDWKEHNKKHDKPECKCMKKHDEYEEMDHLIKFKPNYPLTSKHHEDYSSSFQFQHHKEEKHYKPCKCHEGKKHHIELESSSEEMHKNSYEMPDNIWLGELMSVLYKHNLLNLEPLFDKVHNKKEQHNKPCCKCCHEKHDEKHEYSKEYYFNGMPLKKIKRKHPFK